MTVLLINFQNITTPIQNDTELIKRPPLFKQSPVHYHQTNPFSITLLASLLMPARQTCKDSSKWLLKPINPDSWPYSAYIKCLFWSFLNKSCVAQASSGQLLNFGHSKKNSHTWSFCHVSRKTKGNVCQHFVRKINYILWVINHDKPVTCWYRLPHETHFTSHQLPCNCILNLAAKL